MSFRPTKLSAWVPWSDEDLEDYGDGLDFLRAQGWPNRCARLPPDTLLRTHPLLGDLLMSANPYADTQWRTFRAVFLRSNPRCVCSVCKQHGQKPCGAIANTVDHVTPARAGGVRLFQAMCHSCHSRKTATYDGGFGNAR